jgi:hypothetical protein
LARGRCIKLAGWYDGFIMKWVSSVLCCLSLAGAAEIGAGRTVYLMPMGHGLDQFVANRLTRIHVLQVVTDPSKADVIITDQVGQGFEDRLRDLLPPPPAPPSDDAAKQAAKAKPEAEAKEKGDTPPGSGLMSMLGDTVNKAQAQGYMGVSGRGRGTIFLVDVKSHQVLWSAFEKPGGSSPRDLDHTAERIVKRLKEDLNPKTK